jgi:hypothetical protein
MNTLAHTFTDVDGHTITLVYKNTLRGEIRYRVLRQRFVSNAQGDENERFAYILTTAWIVAVEGTDWQPPDETWSEDSLIANYHAFMGLFADYEDINALVATVNDFKGIHKDEVTMPDEALTDAERADPN